MKRITPLLATAFLLLSLCSVSHAVGYAAPVQITNPDTAPVPVREVKKRTPYIVNANLNPDHNAVNFTPPTGKRFVIEQISGIIQIGSSGAIPRGVGLANLLADGSNGYTFLNYTHSPDAAVWLMTQPTKVVCEMTSTIYLLSLNVQNATVSMHGYLEDLD